MPDLSAVRLYVTSYAIVNLDKITYAGNLKNVKDFENESRYSMVQGSICDKELVCKILDEYQPIGVINLAAETHVDRSIQNAEEFINTNIIGTYSILESCRDYVEKAKLANRFKFIHVSTDEVFGDLSNDCPAFTESNRYIPSSPYSASKASSDHLVRAWHRTYNFPSIITNCSNNYGAYQHSEKLIPTIIFNALKGNKIPIYGSGNQIRDWLYVEDHAKALLKIFESGNVGESYNIGGNCEMTNLEVVSQVCSQLQNKFPEHSSFSALITHIKDRAGHDQRYAVNASKMFEQLGWHPCESFESGISKTVDWYVDYFKNNYVDIEL